MKNGRLLWGINRGEDIPTADPLSFQIHGPKKALFYTVLKLIKPVPLEVLEEMTAPNDRVLLEIYKKYLEVETQEWRRDILERIISFFLLLASEHGDPNYHEVRDWFLYELDAAYERGEKEYNLTDKHPLNWWNETKGGRDWIKITFNGQETTRKVLPQEEI